MTCPHCPHCPDKSPLVHGTDGAGISGWFCRACGREGGAIVSGLTETAARTKRAGLPTRSKYANIKTEIDGITFDSKKEAARYQILALRQSAGEILNLEVHRKYSLDVNGWHVCNYFPDFCYLEAGVLTVEDVKSTSTKTTAYRLKKRLMKALFGIEIKET